MTCQACEKFKFMIDELVKQRIELEEDNKKLRKILEDRQLVSCNNMYNSNG